LRNVPVLLVLFCAVLTTAPTVLEVGTGVGIALAGARQAVWPTPAAAVDVGTIVRLRIGSAVTAATWRDSRLPGVAQGMDWQAVGTLAAAIGGRLLSARAKTDAVSGNVVTDDVVTAAQANLQDESVRTVSGYYNRV